MRDRLHTLLQQLNQGLIGREETVRAALLALLAGENLLLVGPPGTGKSLLAHRISQALAEPDGGPGYFEYLLTKFSTPEELFGPLSISALKQDRFHRQTRGYLPTVQVAFLDEIFKASSSILNALLTVLNERKYHNGTDTEHIPLQALVAASNELPQGQAELAALYDRFLLRRFIAYLTPEERTQLFQLPPAADIEAEYRLSADELSWLRQAAANVRFPAEVQQAVLDIWRAHQEAFKDDADESLSDRRLVKALHLLRVAAAGNGRTEVDFSDLLLLKDCLWNHEANAEKVLALIIEVLNHYNRMVSVDGSYKHRYFDRTISRGDGSENNPILIANIHDLLRLDDPAIGQQGLYFHQTADIDGASLGEDWPSIFSFKGHYDGGGFSICAATDQPLFERLEDATVCRLALGGGIMLANCVENSTIRYCRTSGNLVKRILHSNVSNCITEGSLANEISHSKITACQSGSVLIEDSAVQSQIQDCLVLLNHRNTDTDDDNGGIVRLLTENSQVERCFVTGLLDQKHSYPSFAGIASGVTEGSSIRYCALGRLKVIGSVTIEHRIADFVKDSALEHNISISSNTAKALNTYPNYTSDPCGQDGLSVPAATFKADYLESKLGWDFDTVWQWPKDNKYPNLCITDEMPEPAYGQVSRLKQQCRRNLWLGGQA